MKSATEAQIRSKQMERIQSNVIGPMNLAEVCAALIVCCSVNLYLAPETSFAFLICYRFINRWGRGQYFEEPSPKCHTKVTQSSPASWVKPNQELSQDRRSTWTWLLSRRPQRIFYLKHGANVAVLRQSGLPSRQDTWITPIVLPLGGVLSLCDTILGELFL